MEHRQTINEVPTSVCVLTGDHQAAIPADIVGQMRRAAVRNTDNFLVISTLLLLCHSHPTVTAAAVRPVSTITTRIDRHAAMCLLANRRL